MPVPPARATQAAAHPQVLWARGQLQHTGGHPTPCWDSSCSLPIPLPACQAGQPLPEDRAQSHTHTTNCPQLCSTWPLLRGKRQSALQTRAGRGLPPYNHQKQAVGERPASPQLPGGASTTPPPPTAESGPFSLPFYLSLCRYSGGGVGGSSTVQVPACWLVPARVGRQPGSAMAVQQEEGQPGGPDGRGKAGPTLEQKPGAAGARRQARLQGPPPQLLGTEAGGAPSFPALALG